MATSQKDGTDLLEFCLKPWAADNEHDITEAHAATAGKVASLLTSAKRFPILDRFVSSIPDYVLGIFLKNEQFRRAVIDLRRHQSRYDDICQLIKAGNFSDGSDLLAVWDEAHYAMWQKEYRKPLSALTKFRIRKRNPPPFTICQDGRPTRNLDSSARAVLMAWLKDHRDFPYPHLAEREQLTKETGLTHTQIKTWFANARRRKQNLKEIKQKMEGVGESEVGNLTKTSTSSAYKSLGTAEATVECLGNSPQYLVSSPGAVRTTEPTGIQGLLCMYNKLAAQEPTVPSPPHPSDDVYNHTYPSLSCNRYLPPHKRYTPRCHLSPVLLHETMTAPSLHQTHKPHSGQQGRKLSRGCNVMSPIVHSRTKTAGACDETGQIWNSVISPSVMSDQEFSFTRHPQFVEQFHAMMSPPQSAEFTPKTGARKPAGTTSTYTAAPSPVLSQYQLRDLRVVSMPADPVPVPPSPGSVGLDMLGGSSPLIRDQCLTMWNTSWLSAHSPPRPQTCELGLMEHVPDVLHTSCVNQKPEEDLSVLSISPTGELVRPHSLDTFFILQPTPSTDSNVAQPSDTTQTTFSPHSPVNSTAEDVDEAALILLDLATTKPCLP